MRRPFNLKLTQIFAIFVICVIALSATSLFAEQLIIRYAAQNYEGPPKFRVEAYNKGVLRPVWSSKTIKAKGGIDTKQSTNRNSVVWQTITFEIEPPVNDYFRIRFLNDHAASNPSNGDRNLFVRWIQYKGKRYQASKGKKTASCDRKASVMACSGSLDIKVNNNTQASTASGTSLVKSKALDVPKSICGYTSKSRLSLQQLKATQKVLKSNGFYKGTIDGIMGKGSCAGLNKVMTISDNSRTFDFNTFPNLASAAAKKKSRFKYSRLYVNTNDGRYWDEPKDFIGVDAHFVNASVDGKPTASSDWLIEISGNLKGYRGQGQITGLLFNSKQIFERPLPLSIATSNNTGSRGPQYFFGRYNNIDDRAFFQALSTNDLTTAHAACLALSDAKIVKQVMSQAASQGKHDRQHSNFWKKTNRVSEIQAIAVRCLDVIQSSSPRTRYAAEVTVSGVLKPEGNSTQLKIFSGSSCAGESKPQVRLNQAALEGLDLYTSTIDGISGPNYRKAVANGEKLLRQWADAKKDCLGVSERKILEAVVAARKRGSICEYLPNSTEIKNSFNSLKSAGVIEKEKLDHEKASGLIWMIDTVSNAEMRLSSKNFYSASKSSIRDCRLDDEELKALVPTPAKSPVLTEIPADSVSVAAVKTDVSTTLSLVVEGSDLETSNMPKSVFGLNNQIRMDIKFDVSGGSPRLDFILSESETKLNLHFYDNYVQSAGFAAGLKELTLGKTPNHQSTFSIRMLDSGKSNIDNGDFRKLLVKMPGNDHAMISALCGHMAGISISSEGFEAQFSKPEHAVSFRSSPFSNSKVQNAVNKLASQCVSEVRSTGGVEASFKISVQPIACTAAENEGLASIDAKIAAEQTSLLGVKDEINQLQSQRPLFQFKKCAVYADNAERAAKDLETLQDKVAQAELETKDATTRLNVGRTFAAQLAALKVPADICLIENKTLREDVNEFVSKLDPVFVGIQCPDLDDTSKNPVQIVIDEINAEILALLEVHMSVDEISTLEAERANKRQEFRDLAARLAVFEQSKASPGQVQRQTDTNASLRQTIVDIEARILLLEKEMRDLNGVLANNVGMIEDIDALNQRLVELSAQKERRQTALEATKSKALGAQAVKSQRDLGISKLEGQISNLEIQMEAASSTASTLVEEVLQLGQDIADTTQRVTTLEAEVSEAKGVIDNANSAISQKSLKVSKLDAELSKKVAEATSLSNSVTTLAPQADAAETTVEGMRVSLETDYVPIAEFQEKAARLNELTQAVTERTKLIQELRLDLGSIEQEEQLLIKMCIADGQCKAAMGERLGVDQ
jgi:uncharacterized protein YoxC